MEKIRSVTVDGWTVSVEMKDGTVYPFRTHPAAALLFSAAPALHAALVDVEFLLSRVGSFSAPETVDQLVREALGEVREALAVFGSQS